MFMVEVTKSVSIVHPQIGFPGTVGRCVGDVVASEDPLRSGHPCDRGEVEGLRRARDRGAHRIRRPLGTYIGT